MKASEFRALIKEQVKKVLSEAWNAVDSKLLTNHETLTPAVYRNLMLNAKKGILKHMTRPDGKIHFWNPATKEYVAKLITYNGKGEYLYSNAIDKAGNLVEGINESVLKENVDATVKKLKNLIKSQFTIIDFKAPAKRTSSNEEFLMVKVKDDKYGGPKSGLGKVIKKHTGVEASFIDNYGNDKVYWVSLEKIENSPVSRINENFPGVGETVDAKDINYDMKSYFNRTNRKLEITTKDNKKANGTVNKFYNDLIFATKEKWDIPVKDILKVKILEKIENSPVSGINESAMGDVD